MKNRFDKSGEINSNNQRVIANTLASSTTHPNQTIYLMECLKCNRQYGANGCDIHIRMCPFCQGGKQGEPILLSYTEILKAHDEEMAIYKEAALIKKMLNQNNLKKSIDILEEDIPHKVGDSVQHEVYGSGKILEIILNENLTKKLKIKFNDFDEIKIMMPAFIDIQ